MRLPRSRAFARNDENILGGLSPSDAERTWRTLSIEMEKAGNHEEAVKYFGLALDAKCLNTEKEAKKQQKLIAPEKNDAVKTEYTLFSLRLILWLYKLTSHYGQSIARPFWWWLGVFCFFSILYYCLIIPSDIVYAFKFGFKGLFPFVADQTTFFDRMFADPQLPFEQCYKHDLYNKEPIVFNKTLELLIFPLLYGLHTFLSLILIFLFGLGVRNRLRLR
jgi:hypothetical protein